MNPQGQSGDAIDHRKFAIVAAAEAAELRIQVRRLEAENRVLHRRLDRIYASWTWRAGRLVLLPYHVLKGLKSRISQTR